MELVNLAKAGDAAGVQELLASDKMYIRKNKNLALRWAARRGHVDVVNILLTAGANVHSNDERPVCAAAEYGHVAVVEALLRAGAHVHASNDWPVRIASENGHLVVVKTLLEAGAALHTWDDYALRLASYNGHLAVVNTLLAAGADVHVYEDGHLRLAAVGGHLAVVKTLLDAGANVNALDDDAIFAAYQQASWEVVKTLLQAGASILRFKDKVDEATIRFAVNCGHDPISFLELTQLSTPMRKFLLLSVQPRAATQLTPKYFRKWCKLRGRLRLRLRRFWYDRCVPKLWALPMGTLPADPTEEELTTYLATAGRLWARTYWKEDVHMFFPALGARLGACPF